MNTPFTILWNDGPRLKKLHNELKKIDLAPNEKGKGRNVWYCLGMSIARDNARSVALHDCDIKTYDRRMLAKLFYPVVNPLFNFEFCKGYYPRVAKGKNAWKSCEVVGVPSYYCIGKNHWKKRISRVYEIF